MLGFRAGRGRDFRGVYMKILVFVRGVWRGSWGRYAGGAMSRFGATGRSLAVLPALRSGRELREPHTAYWISAYHSPDVHSDMAGHRGYRYRGRGSHDEFALQTDRTWCEKKTFRRRVRIRLGGRPGAPDQSRRPIR